MVLRGSISAQQTAASCRRQRARAITATTESRQKHARTSVLAALPLPNHGESAAADLAASYTGLGIPVLPIEAARIYAPGISTGAVAVFRAFSTPNPAPPRAVRWEFVREFAHQSPPAYLPRINMIGIIIMHYVSFSRDLRDDRRLAHRVRDTV